MEPYQQRVIDEKTSLDEKQKKLVAFFATDTFKLMNVEDTHLMVMQNEIMKQYSDILAKRIARFK